MGLTAALPVSVSVCVFVCVFRKNRQRNTVQYLDSHTFCCCAGSVFQHIGFEMKQWLRGEAADFQYFFVRVFCSDWVNRIGNCSPDFVLLYYSKISWLFQYRGAHTLKHHMDGFACFTQPSTGIVFILDVQCQCLAPVQEEVVCGACHEKTSSGEKEALHFSYTSLLFEIEAWFLFSFGWWKWFWIGLFNAVDRGDW